jgi:uncharacterized protein (DUF433 family)
MRTTLIAIAVGLFSSAAFAADPSAINPYSHIVDTRAELAQTYPELTSAELDRLVFRVGDARSMLMLRAIPVATITAVNPRAFYGATRSDLAVAFPWLTKKELDELQFRIADAQSMDRLYPAFQTASVPQ